jgi:hypothetical protein
MTFVKPDMRVEALVLLFHIRQVMVLNSVEFPAILTEKLLGFRYSLSLFMEMLVCYLKHIMLPLTSPPIHHSQ